METYYNRRLNIAAAPPTRRAQVNVTSPFGQITVLSTTEISQAKFVDLAC
jgi:hypothetical protein